MARLVILQESSASSAVNGGPHPPVRGESHHRPLVLFLAGRILFRKLESCACLHGLREKAQQSRARRAIVPRRRADGRGTLTARAGVSQPAVSKHLGVLKQAGLVRDRAFDAPDRRLDRDGIRARL